MKRLFGTDGIRGKAGEFPLDPGAIHVIGFSLARHLAQTNGRSPQLVIGRDTRESGPWIEQALMAGAREAGAEIQSAGVITTPGVAFLARALSVDAGVVISASHNPYYDNGIKVFQPSGRKIDDAIERQIEADVTSVSANATVMTEGERVESSELKSRYMSYLAGEIGTGLSLSQLKIVVDCANGAAFEIAPEVFRRLGAEVIAINNQPNGRNINLDCGSLHIEGLQERVITERAHLGVAFDGDADRALFVDADGSFVDGDATLWVLANYLRARGQLPDDIVVATVMSNIGLEIALKSEEIRLVRTDVGDKYVLEEMLKSGASLGGEQSGHIIFPKITLAGDGIITSIMLLRAMVQKQKSLAELSIGFHRYPQLLVNVRVREKRPFEELPFLQSAANEIHKKLGGRGRLLLRYSGTEPLARVMIEGEDENQIKTYAEELAGKIQQELGAPN